MLARRWLPWIALLGASLHLVGIARSTLPAQDGLKFIRVARQFHRQPWMDVIRGSDQHPLYPAAVALVEPAVSALRGDGPDTWRIAAQLVSALASLATLWPVFALTRALFNERPAALAALLFVLLPVPALIGRETLADALALAALAYTLWLGERTLATGSPLAAIGCGLSAGLGYWTRPEVAIAPVAVLLTAGVRALAGGINGRKLVDRFSAAAGFRAEALVAVALLFLVGTYALVKGEVSEKLAIRRAASLASRHDAPRSVGHALPPGLEDREVDFSPKEESDDPSALGRGAAIARAVTGWIEGLGWIFAPLAILGMIRVKAGPGRRVLAIYAALFALAVLRHAMTLGYLSGRHTLSLVLVSLPWAAAYLDLMARRLAGWCRWSGVARSRFAAASLGGLIVLGVGAQQAKPSHPSRWGHLAAGRWIAEHRRPGDAVLDTRGWAAFVAGEPSYDYWHIRQALTDDRLACIVVGRDELEADSPRAATLRALLDYAGRAAATFPEREGGHGSDVLVYRYRRPESWEGLRP